MSSGMGPCFPMAGGLCKFYANAGGNQPMQRQLLLVQYKQQANPNLSVHNYTPLVISRNDKNKQSINSAVARKNGNKTFTGKFHVQNENKPRSPWSQTSTKRFPSSLPTLFLVTIYLSVIY
jgi:hypothetical protein